MSELKMMELETEILSMRKELMKVQRESEDLIVGMDLKYEREVKNLKKSLEIKENKIEQLEKNLENTMKEWKEEKWKWRDNLNESKNQNRELSELVEAMMEGMNFKKEKEVLKNKKLIVALVIAALVGISAIVGIKHDISRVKDKIIKIHGYSLSFNYKNLDENIEKI